MDERLFEFVWLPTFERAAKKLAKGGKETLTREEEKELRKLAHAILSEETK